MRTPLVLAALAALGLAGCSKPSPDPTTAGGLPVAGTTSTTDTGTWTGTGSGTGSGTGTGTGAGTGSGTGSGTGGGSSSCAAPLPLTDPGSVSGDTTTAVDISVASCQYGGGTDDVYEFTPAQTGYADIALTSTADLGVFVQTTCNDPAAEIGCADWEWGGYTEYLTVDVTAGVPVYVFVGGYSMYDYGPYDLVIASATHQCGDGVVSGTETCDDTNTTPGDGCDSSCLLEVTETEPNDSDATADLNTVQYEVGLIDAPYDMDWWAVDITIPTGATSMELTASVIDVQAVFGNDLGVGLCSDYTLDSEIEILDGAGNSLADNDDNYADYCSTATAAITTDGTYYVRVASSQTWAPTGQFGYGLEITTVAAICGDGAVAGAEQCDDGNTDAGDGCDGTCQLELSETEPNDDYTTADPAVPEFIGLIDPAGEHDWIAIELTGTSNSLAIETSDATGFGNCDDLDTEMTLYDTDGTTYLAYDDDTGPDYCSKLEFTGMAAGTYYLDVSMWSAYDTGNYIVHINAAPEVCGDGIRALTEQCDDGNLVAGDGCSDTCQLEVYGFSGCPSGTLNTYSASNLGLPFQGNTVSSDVLVNGAAGTVQSAVVRIDELLYFYTFDIDLFLASPSGKRIELSTGNGDGYGYTDYLLTEFDDVCLTVDGPITSGTAPFTGCYSPEGSLADFIGDDPNGNWSLEVTDNFGYYQGTLNAWSLGLCL